MGDMRIENKQSSRPYVAARNNLSFGMPLVVEPIEDSDSDSSVCTLSPILSRTFMLCESPRDMERKSPDNVCMNCNAWGHLKINCRFNRCMSCNKLCHMAFECDERYRTNAAVVASEGACAYDVAGCESTDVVRSGGVRHNETALQMHNYDKPGFNPSLRTLKMWDFDDFQIKYIRDRKAVADELCSICCMPFNDRLDAYYNSPKVQILKCLHISHEACLEPCLNQKSCCPVCKCIIEVTDTNGFTGMVER